MKVASNKIADVRRYIKEGLQGVYPVEEVQSFAFMLFEQFCGMSMAQVLAQTRETINESELLLVYDAVKELQLQRPIQHILGHTRFYGLNLKVNQHVLIPRPETEELVEMVIKQNYYKPQLKILDIGTGSGCIAIALKKNMPDAHITAVDISGEALAVARQNADANDTEIHFVQADILNPSEWAPLTDFDLVVSNPPYVLETEKALMHANVLNFEPHAALFVPDRDALLFYKAIFGLAKSKNKRCSMYTEINESKGADLMQLAQLLDLKYAKVEKDMHGKERFFVAKI
ncbi:MAG: peptide chain release factor N(5)-glutamine methyltransferase [Bacteroidota bacterium]